MHIQKMGRWRGETFKEYVREELYCFLDGMAKDMKQCFHFVNVTGHAFMIYHSIHSLQCYNPANEQCTNTCSRITSGMNWLLATRFYGTMNDGTTKIKVAADLLFAIWQTIQFPNTVMVTQQSEIHMRGTRQMPTWYMHPPAYPPRWGAFLSHSPFLWPHKAIGGPIKRGARVCNSHTKPCNFLAPSSIHSLCSIQSHSRCSE